MTPQFFTVAALAVLLILLIVLLVIQKPGSGFPVISKPILTKRERVALEALEAAFPDCRIFPQVAMGALIQPKKGLEKQQRAKVRNRFSQKIIEDRADNEVRYLVELDDRTHDTDKDRSRDAMTLAAGYRTVRIPPGFKLELASILTLCAPSDSAHRSPVQLSTR